MIRVLAPYGRLVVLPHAARTASHRASGRTFCARANFSGRATTWFGARATPSALATPGPLQPRRSRLRSGAARHRDAVCGRRLRGVFAVYASGAVCAALPPQRNARLLQACTAFTNLFPLWVALGACLGLLYPPAVTWFQGSMITVALAVTMLGMGLTMDAADILDAVQSPGQVALGVGLQFTIMPLLAFGLSRLLPLPTPIAVGLILVGCCPGGTASNLVTYIAGANVALSVVLTACSTLLASVATPALCAALAGTLVPVPAAGLMVSTAQVVLAPVALGVALKRVAPTAVAAAAPLCPPIAVATVALICASVIGGAATAVRSAGPLLLAAVFLLHAGGFALGYAGAATAKCPEKVRRTVAIEVGMQNSALGCVLALAHFADPATAVPAAVSATVHSVLGSALAGAWRLRDAQTAAPTGAVLRPL